MRRTRRAHLLVRELDCDFRVTAHIDDSRLAWVDSCGFEVIWGNPQTAVCTRTPANVAAHKECLHRKEHSRVALAAPWPTKKDSPRRTG